MLTLSPTLARRLLLRGGVLVVLSLLVPRVLVEAWNADSAAERVWLGLATLSGHVGLLVGSVVLGAGLVAREVLRREPVVAPVDDRDWFSA